MKAIQIRFLPATNHKCVRLKVWAEGVKPLIVSRDYSIDHDIQARELAKHFISKCGWGVTYNGFGCLPNGDYVATLGE